MNYTPAAGQRCVRATVDVVVDSTGTPALETARVVQATDPGLGVAVLESLSSTQYDPAVKNGQPVAQLVRIERSVVTTMVAVPAGTPPSSVRPPRRPVC